MGISRSVQKPAFAFPPNTRDPSATDDSSAGGSSFSAWLNSTRMAAWLCLDATAGAASWIKLGLGGHKKRSGRYYPVVSALQVTGTGVGAVDTLYVTPFIWDEAATISSILGKVSTAGANSSMSCAVYASKNGLPYGAPILSGTGASTATAGSATVNVTGTLKPGLYFIASKFTFTTGGALPQMVSISSTDPTVECLLGRSNPASNTFAVGMSIANAYSAAFPTFDGTETWTDVTTNGVPHLRLGVA